MGQGLFLDIAGVDIFELKYSGTRLIRHPKGPTKKCRIIRVVGLNVVKYITKIQKGLKMKCRIIRVVRLTVVGLTVFHCTSNATLFCFTG